MTPNCIHLTLLINRLSLAESTQDIEGQATERAWIACDQRTKEQTVAFKQRGKERG